MKVTWFLKTDTPSDETAHTLPHLKLFGINLAIKLESDKLIVDCRRAKNLQKIKLRGHIFLTYKPHIKTALCSDLKPSETEFPTDFMWGKLIIDNLVARK